MNQKKLVVLTGGGTAGHVMPNLALLPELRKNGFDVSYIGSKGIEKDLAQKCGITFHEISTGKLRRYFSMQNFLDIFRIVAGFFQAFILMVRLKPCVVFSKGGFVAVPVTLAAWVCGIPVITHESDYSPGLANKMIGPFSRKILYTFPETGRYLDSKKSILVGTPVRQELFAGDASVGASFCGFSDGKPVLLVMGGSQGAQRINESLKQVLPDLLKHFNVVHLTGKGKSIGFSNPGYRGFEFIGEQLKDVFAASTIVVSRAGANSIFELLALKKPMMLIPLEIGSRGDQILNANSFEAKGWARQMKESTMTAESLRSSIFKLFEDRQSMISAQESAAIEGVPTKIVQILMTEARASS